jgi:putative ABC transport system permease protein
MVTDGLKQSVNGSMKAGNTDFSVAKAGSADLLMSFLKQEQADKIANVEGVEDIAPYVMTVTALGTNPYFIIGGLDESKIDLAGGKIIEGRAYQNNSEIILGKIAARNLNVKVGGQLELNKKKYDVVGIFESGITMQDGGSLTTVAESQSIQGIRDQYNLVFVKAKKNYDIKKVAENIENSDKDFISIIDQEDVNKVETGMPIIDDISVAISILAVVIGGIGVMNTIIMSVFERTREIGVLRAIGWKRKRIMAMIMCESFFIGLLSAICGIALGLAVIFIVMQTSMGKSWLTMNYDPNILIQAVVVSFCVVFIGAIYPAYKASKLQPTEALRYE